MLGFNTHKDISSGKQQTKEMRIQIFKHLNEFIENTKRFSKPKWIQEKKKKVLVQKNKSL